MPFAQYIAIMGEVKIWMKIYHVDSSEDFLEEGRFKMHIDACIKVAFYSKRGLDKIVCPIQIRTNIL